MSMNIDVSKNGTSLLITVSGRIDPTTASAFEKAVMGNLDGMTLKNVQGSVLEVLKVTGYIKFLNIQ